MSRRKTPSATQYLVLAVLSLVGLNSLTKVRKRKFARVAGPMNKRKKKVLIAHGRVKQGKKLRAV